MAVRNFEKFNLNQDSTTTRTLLHEVIPLTGSIVSGTYMEAGATGFTPTNIKNYTHGQFQSVYDYPYLSSSANHIFDLTVGYDEGSVLSGSLAADGFARVQQAKKINMYNQFAQVLLGYSGSAFDVEKFESDLDFGDNDAHMNSVFFVNFARLITKDQIKKGSFSITLGTGSWGNPFGLTAGNQRLILSDLSASDTGFTKETRGGDYGVLYNSTASSETGLGVVFYQAGIAIITSSVFHKFDASGNPSENPIAQFYKDPDYGMLRVNNAFISSSISGACDALRHRIYNISYNNTTEINSTIYFCRVPHNKFNYSANPTFVSGSKIRVKNVASDTPVTYLTTIGLYDDDNQLVATAKLSEPLRKDPTNEVTLRVRLDY